MAARCPVAPSDLPLPAGLGCRVLARTGLRSIRCQLLAGRHQIHHHQDRHRCRQPSGFRQWTYSAYKVRRGDLSFSVSTTVVGAATSDDIRTLINNDTHGRDGHGWCNSGPQATLHLLDPGQLQAEGQQARLRWRDAEVWQLSAPTKPQSSRPRRRAGHRRLLARPTRCPSYLSGTLDEAWPERIRQRHGVRLSGVGSKVRSKYRPSGKFWAIDAEPI